MKLSSMIAQARVLTVTIALGLAFTSLAILAHHYYAAAQSAVAEKEAMRAEMRSLVERLADIEASLNTVADYRKTLDAMTLTEFETVLDRAGLRSSSEAGIKVAMRSHPIAGDGGDGGGQSTIQSYSGALVYGQVIDRLANAKGRADTLSSELRGTAEILSQRQAILSQIPSVLPAKGWISSEFGVRESPFHQGTEKMHNGIDIAADPGTPVYATADGIVAFAGSFGSYGKFIKINHGFGISTRYAHNAEFLVKKGDTVKRGQQIALIGVTGRTTAPHLYYEVMVYEQPVNPRRFFFDAKPQELTASAEKSLLAQERPMGGDAETAGAQGGEASSFEEAAAAALDVAQLESDAAAFYAAWDAPVLALEKGMLARIAPASFRSVTTGDLATLAVIFVLIAIAAATMRMPEPLPAGEPLSPLERYLLRQRREEIEGEDKAPSPWGRLKLLWITFRERRGAPRPEPKSILEE